MQSQFIQPKPNFLKHHCFKTSWLIKKPIKAIWKTLNTMETFSNAQLFPYRVEFVDSDKKAAFKTGVWTNHHGPLLNACGQIGEMKTHEYRDLNYSYGSYVLSFRVIRPVRLQFFFREDPNGTLLSVQFDCFVAPSLYKCWDILMKIFWRGFGNLIFRKTK